MTKSDPLLSIVLPVHNIQNSLPTLVSEVMETVSDLVPYFELILIDNGSTDRTEEVVAELALQYPQVRHARHSVRREADAVIRTGYAHATGQVVLVQRENAPLRAAELLQLGNLAAERGMVVRPNEMSTVEMGADEPLEAPRTPRPQFLSRPRRRQGNRRV